MTTIPRQVVILDGTTFVVSDARGDFHAGPDEAVGFFYRDMRHLSRWQLRLNGRPLDVLSGQALEYDDAVFFLVEYAGRWGHARVVLTRRRHVGEGLLEHLEVTNHHHDDPITIELSLLFDADFADIFEVKDAHATNHVAKATRRSDSVEPDRVRLRYQRGDLVRETVIEAPGAFITRESLTYRVVLKPRETWTTEIQLTVATETRRPSPKLVGRQANLPVTLQEWLDGAPRLDTDWDDLRRTYLRSMVDLAALRYYPDTVPDSSLPAAGLPWFMALFGRDSLIASYQALPFVPELCRTTLYALAVQQATDHNDARDAEPGKILHELRYGELSRFYGSRPTPYYGSVDATPLFLVVLDEYERWTGDVDTVRRLEAPARAAMAWIERYGDLDGDGYLEYSTRNPDVGLENQCWKDSWNSIVHPDGAVATMPRATCEVQGYAYDARRRMARLARDIWHDTAYADRLEADADHLRTRFNQDFWLADEGFYALALDGDKRPVPTLTSNIGHLLWSGIVPADRVDRLTEHLVGEGLFSGWGVRTLAAGCAAYNPVQYHNGTVWPHDTSLVAAGLARYGRRAEAARLAEAMLEAARFFDYRLPEVFVGYDRRHTSVPVSYPTACSPQAWASGAPLLFLRTVMGMEPRADSLVVRPHLPPSIRRLVLRGVPGRWGRADAVAVR